MAPPDATGRGTAAATQARRSDGRPGGREEARMTGGGEAARRTALVVTCSDRSFEGTRPDASGEALQARLEALGFAVERAVVPDDRAAIGAALLEGTARHRLVLTTGGTGL